MTFVGHYLYSEDTAGDFSRLRPSTSAIQPPNTPDIKPESDEIRNAAEAFEASFIAQMLAFSGLDKALTTGGGEDMSAFSSFYIESLAADITENGGFGLADMFYDRLVALSDPQTVLKTESSNVDFGRV